VFFYLRIVVMMWMTRGRRWCGRASRPAAAAGLVPGDDCVFYLGVLPTRILQLALDSILTIF
jgi:NADH:ubiquinone oxidoreductase subunit 2 (subunit N)